MSRISQADLEKYLFGCADILRNHVEASAYRDYIFPLLFFKRISDVYDEDIESAKREYGDAWTSFPEDEIHDFSIPDGCHWDDLRIVTDNVGAAIQKSFQGIESLNADKLGGVFGNANWSNKTELPDRMLKDLVEHLSSLTLSIENCPEDELGHGYEYLIGKFDSDDGHTAQEFYTNRTVAHLMAEMLNPQSRESIYDPTCGSGGILISCIDHIKKRGDEWRNVKVYGQEIVPLTASICRMNLFLHGVKEFTIRTGDTLSTPTFLERDRLKTFDLVVANPPYSISNWDRDAFSTDKYGRNILGTPPQGRADYAFIQHILKSMDPETGRCAILLPHGVLFRNEELEMRKKLVQSDMIEAVIGIGKNLFYNSPMEACILVCRAKKPLERLGRILFINARHEVTRKNAESFLEDSHIEKIASVYAGFNDMDGFSHIADYEEIKNNGFELSLALYVDDNRDAEAKPFEKSFAEWNDIHQKVVRETMPLIEMIIGGDDNA